MRRGLHVERIPFLTAIGRSLGGRGDSLGALELCHSMDDGNEYKLEVVVEQKLTVYKAHLEDHKS